MNCHFMGFHQLVQKLERITPVISTLQDKQNEWSFYGFSLTGPKVRTNNTNHFYFSISQMVIYGFSTNDLKVINVLSLRNSFPFEIIFDTCFMHFLCAP